MFYRIDLGDSSPSSSVSKAVTLGAKVSIEKKETLRKGTVEDIKNE